jgi:uncharacterized protein
MIGAASGFDWDAGNREKCLRHGVSIAEIEELLRGPVRVLPDIDHSQVERRFLAVGRSKSRRWIFLSFTFRWRDGVVLLRPISARYMHRKEIAYYEKEISDP